MTNVFFFVCFKAPTSFIPLAGVIQKVFTVLNQHNQKISWMTGKWRSEFSGKIFWPTVPTMTFGEELVILEAPMAKSSNVQFLNFSARAWSHSTKDHFHDEWGFVTVDPNGNATLMTTGNNGFTTYEVGVVKPNKLVLTLKDIGRISFSRDLPVEDLRRTFIKHDDTYMEQILEMRTATHPKQGYLEHTRVIYTKQKM
uniref:THAP4-like heme-binding beta-barrel domain-containing protein n=1 Tax=Panagrolaimus sp. ES5 TaxID=591445 RepID=A0AC34GV80_9BILA